MEMVAVKILAQLYASGFLPEVWTPDPLTEATLENTRLHRLLTITGVVVTVAISLLAAIGHIGRFAPRYLIS